jgi:hypothetical protein
METSWEQHGNIVIKEFLSPHPKGKKDEPSYVYI